MIARSLSEQQVSETTSWKDPVSTNPIGSKQSFIPSRCEASRSILMWGLRAGQRDWSHAQAMSFHGNGALSRFRLNINTIRLLPIHQSPHAFDTVSLQFQLPRPDKPKFIDIPAKKVLIHLRDHADPIFPVVVGSRDTSRAPETYHQNGRTTKGLRQTTEQYTKSCV